MSKKIIHNILRYAADSEAASLSLENESQHISLNYSLPDGESRSFKLPKKLEKELSENIRQILKLAPDELINKKYCRVENKNCRLSFWLTIVPTKNGDRIIIKIIPKNNRPFRLSQLGLERQQLKIVKKVLNKKSGLILISSPDNQGKSATLNALIKEIDKPNLSSYFLGRELEQEFANVSSLADNKNNWAKVLNLDSDVIITEVNSEANWQNVILAANSGRLVLATYRADSIWDVMDKYLKIKMPLKLKLAGLSLIINQKLRPLKRALPRNLSLLRSDRQEIALFEFLEATNRLKNFLITIEKEKDKTNFWRDLTKLVKENDHLSKQKSQTL